MPNHGSRRYFIGGSDARIIMGNDEAALLRLWREKRGEVEPEDLSSNLTVQLGVATEELNRRWYQANTGQVHHGYPAADPASGPSVDGCHPRRPGRGQRRGVRSEIHAAVVVLGGSGGAETYAQLQHNMWVVAARSAVLSVITGGGKWVEITTHADPLYQHLLITAERKFWRCVETRRAPRPVRAGAAEAPHRGGPHCRYELVQCLG